MPKHQKDDIQYTVETGAVARLQLSPSQTIALLSSNNQPYVISESPESLGADDMEVDGEAQKLSWPIDYIPVPLVSQSTIQSTEMLCTEDCSNTTLTSAYLPLNYLQPHAEFTALEVRPTVEIYNVLHRTFYLHLEGSIAADYCDSDQKASAQALLIQLSAHKTLIEGRCKDLLKSRGCSDESIFTHEYSLSPLETQQANDVARLAAQEGRAHTIIASRTAILLNILQHVCAPQTV